MRYGDENFLREFLRALIGLKTILQKLEKIWLVQATLDFQGNVSAQQRLSFPKFHISEL